MCTVRHSNALYLDDVRELTLQEKKNLRPGDRIYFVALCGHLLPCKVNGKPQIWKTRPEQVKIPVKYGLYEYSYFTERNEIYVPK